MNKKIAIVYDGLPEWGMERVLVNMLQRFDYDQYRVDVWIKDSSKAVAQKLDHRVCIRYWGQAADLKSVIYRQLKKGHIFNAIRKSFFGLLSKICSLTKDWYHSDLCALISSFPTTTEKYDCVIAYEAQPITPLQITTFLLRTKKRIAWVHSSFEKSVPLGERHYYRPLYKRMNHIVCVSNDAKTVMDRCFSAFEQKTTVIYNIHNIANIRQLANEKVPESFDGLTFVTVGRLTEIKGQRMIPSIAADLTRRGYRFVWYLVGDGQIRKELEESIHEKSMEKTVFILGMKENPYPYIKNCSLYIQTSLAEGFCLATFEAKILGVPVVSTCFPAIYEQFAEDEAFFAEPSVTSLTCTIEHAISLLNLPVKYEPVTEEYNQEQMRKLYALL